MTNDFAFTLDPPHPGIVDPGHFADGESVTVDIWGPRQCKPRPTGRR